MAFDRTRRVSFDGVADLYAEVRPGYPERLFEDVVAFSGIAPSGRILEIGCGPGNATIPFAERGFEILGLELGERMAALARNRCRGFPRVRVEHVAFEEWPLERGAFDLVIAASAFHWIEPDVGYPKAAAALRDGGTLALFWNRTPLDETPLRSALDAAYRRIAPEIARGGGDGPLPLAAQIRRTIDEIDASGAFGPVEVRRYRWSARHDTERYLRLLGTHSDHLALPEASRRDLFEAIRAEIERAGGIIERPYLTALHLARMRR